MPIVLNHNGLFLWHATESTQELISRAQLSDKQRFMLSEVNFDLRKNLWLAARVVAREIFNDTIAYTPDGAPFLVQTQQHISISHTADMLAFYSAATPCGVDIEHRDRDASGVARRFANQFEIETVKQTYPHNAELLIWCAKEVLYKMTQVPGAEFANDFKVVGATDSELRCLAFATPVTIQYRLYEDYLIANSL